MKTLDLFNEYVGVEQEKEFIEREERPHYIGKGSSGIDVDQDPCARLWRVLDKRSKELYEEIVKRLSDENETQ